MIYDIQGSLFHSFLSSGAKSAKKAADKDAGAAQTKPMGKGKGGGAPAVQYALRTAGNFRVDVFELKPQHCVHARCGSARVDELPWGRTSARHGMHFDARDGSCGSDVEMSFEKAKLTAASEADWVRKGFK